MFDVDWRAGGRGGEIRKKVLALLFLLVTSPICLHPRQSSTALAGPGPSLGPHSLNQTLLSPRVSSGLSGRDFTGYTPGGETIWLERIVLRQAAVLGTNQEACRRSHSDGSSHFHALQRKVCARLAYEDWSGLNATPFMPLSTISDWRFDRILRQKHFGRGHFLSSARGGRS